MTLQEHAVIVLTPLAAMLGLAVWRDLSRHRIDNWITLPGAVIAIGLHVLLDGAGGLLSAFGGLAAGLVVLLPLHVLGGMAAGDVKLMAAAGAFLGPVDALLGAASSLLAGSVLALGVLAARGGLREGLGHIGRQALATSMTRVWVAAPPGSAAAQRFPYALAIATGCLAVATWRLLGTAASVVH